MAIVKSYDLIKSYQLCFSIQEKMSDKCREFLKEKIKTLSGECEEKKGMVEVLTRVDGELRGEIAEREKEVKELRPLCARKEALLR